MTSTPLASSPPRKRKRFARPNGKLIAGGVVLLLALVAAWFFFLRGGGDADPGISDGDRHAAAIGHGM